jgi:hypothetical protein
VRDFEEDFNFDSEQRIADRRMCDFRQDVYKSLDFGSEEKRLNDPKRQARISAHRERVQRELVRRKI